MARSANTLYLMILGHLGMPISVSTGWKVKDMCSELRNDGSKLGGRVSRILVPTMTAVGILTGISMAGSVHADLIGDPVAVTEASRIDSIYGAYLAAGQAEATHDFPRAAALLERILETRPDDPLLQRRAMLANLHAGRIDRATEMARPQTVVYPSEVDIASTTLAVDAMLREDWDRAIKLLTPARRIALARYSTPVLIAWSEFGRGNVDAGIVALGDLRNDAQAIPVHDLHAGLIFLAADRPAEAEAILAGHETDLSSTPNGIVRVLARAKLALGDSDAARDLLGRYQAIDPDNDLVNQDKASLEENETLPPMIASPQAGASEVLVDLASQVQRQAPLFALQYSRLGVHLDPDSPSGKMIIAVILQNLERYEDAISELKTIPEESVYGWDAKMRVADNLIQLKRHDEAVAWLEELAMARPDDITALDKLGLIMRIEERFTEAKLYYDRSLERVDTVGPDHWALFYFLGITLERTDRWPEAEAAFRRSLELSPDQPFVLNYLGYSWVDQGINITEGLEMIQKAVEARPNDGNIVDSLGWAYYRLGDYDEAVVHLERAIQLLPSEPVIADHLGDAYWKVGRRVEARYQWDHTLTLNPDDKLKTTVEEKLRIGLDAFEAAASD